MSKLFILILVVLMPTVGMSSLESALDEKLGNSILWEEEYTVLDSDVIKTEKECKGDLRGSMPYKSVIGN